MSFEAQLPASSRRLYKETRVGMANGQVTARASWACDYADLWTFLTVANGTLETVNGTVQRIVPLRFPDNPNNMLAVKVDVRETGYDRNANTYSKCVIDIDFATPQFGITGQNAFMVRTLNAGGNMVTLPGSAYSFSGGTKVNADVGRLVPEGEITFTLFQVPTNAESTILGLVGNVNSGAFLGYAAGTILFPSGFVEVQTTALFVQSYQMQLVFSYRPVPWNSLMKPDGTGFAAVTDGSGNGIYPTADLSPLLAF